MDRAGIKCVARLADVSKELEPSDWLIVVDLRLWATEFPDQTIIAWASNSYPGVTYFVDVGAGGAYTERVELGPDGQVHRIRRYHNTATHPPPATSRPRLR